MSVHSRPPPLPSKVKLRQHGRSTGIYPQVYVTEDNEASLNSPRKEQWRELSYWTTPTYLTPGGGHFFTTPPPVSPQNKPVSSANHEIKQMSGMITQECKQWDFSLWHDVCTFMTMKIKTELNVKVKNGGKYELTLCNYPGYFVKDRAVSTGRNASKRGNATTLPRGICTEQGRSEVTQALLLCPSGTVLPNSIVNLRLQCRNMQDWGELCPKEAGAISHHLEFPFGVRADWIIERSGN